MVVNLLLGLFLYLLMHSVITSFTNYTMIATIQPTSKKYYCVSQKYEFCLVIPN